MRSPLVFVLIAIGAAVLASGCTSRSLIAQDAAQASVGADAGSDAPRESSADHPSVCYPLFHACTAAEECCAPNRCLNITGTPTCQQEGPAVDAILPVDLSPPDSIPKADPDGGTCSQPPGESMGVVCFGSDPLRTNST